MKPPLAKLLPALEASGLVSQAVVVREFPGNADRKPERVRWHGLVSQANGPLVKLTIGRDLTAIAERSRDFAAQFPASTPRRLFFTRIDGWQMLATKAVDGPLFEDLGKDAVSAARMLEAIATLETTFHASEHDSPAGSFVQEWKRFENSVEALPCWSPSQQRMLVHALLHSLGKRLSPACARQRWTNGDFISTNICLDPSERPIVFDAEYASCTHFFPEDTVRFRRISLLCHRHPALLEGWWGRADPAWEIFFQLRQLTLEHAENSEAYLARVAPERLAAIRYFGESWIGPFSTDWPEPVEPVPRATDRGESSQLFWCRKDEAFSEQQSQRVDIPAGTRQLVSFRVPENARALRLDPVHSQRKVRLYSLTPVHCDPAARAAKMSLTFQNAHTRRFSDHIEVDPTNPDPQIHFALPPGSLGLVVDLECF